MSSKWVFLSQAVIKKDVVTWTGSSTKYRSNLYLYCFWSMEDCWEINACIYKNYNFFFQLGVPPGNFRILSFWFRPYTGRNRYFVFWCSFYAQSSIKAGFSWHINVQTLPWIRDGEGEVLCWFEMEWPNILWAEQGLCHSYTHWPLY